MGLSAYARNGVVAGILNNTPFVVPVWCGSLHAGDPGVEGTNAVATLVDTEEERSQITCAAPVNGVGSSTGDPATWDVTGSATITHAGFHDAFSGGNWMGREPLAQPVQVANGDVVKLATFSGQLP